MAKLAVKDQRQCLSSVHSVLYIHETPDLRASPSTCCPRNDGGAGAWTRLPCRVVCLIRVELDGGFRNTKMIGLVEKLVAVDVGWTTRQGN